MMTDGVASPRGLCLVAVLAGAFALALANGNPAIAAANQPPQVQISLSDDLVPAPDGFVAVAQKYVTVRTTDLYISPFIWAGKVKNIHLAAGQPVEVLGQPKGYDDWLLVGRNGTGIGYVPRSDLTEAPR